MFRDDFKNLSKSYVSCQKQQIKQLNIVVAQKNSHHLHHFYFCIQSQVVKEHLEVFLHLNAVVIHLGHSEDTHLRLPPHLDEERAQSLWKEVIRKNKLEWESEIDG